jgi:hypothetical protein
VRATFAIETFLQAITQSPTAIFSHSSFRYHNIKIIAAAFAVFNPGLTCRKKVRYAAASPGQIGRFMHRALRATLKLSAK